MRHVINLFYNKYTEFAITLGENMKKAASWNILCIDVSDKCSDSKMSVEGNLRWH